MRNTNIIVAFRSKKTADAVTRILNLGGIGVAVECRSGAEAKKQMAYFGSGILICGYSFRDTSIISFIDDVPESFSVVLIGNYSQISMCENERVFKLAVPLSKSDLIYSITMLMNMESKYSSASIPVRRESEIALIDEAKRVLIDKYHMSEEQAHRYMQKKSMNTGIKLVEIARIILN